MGRAWRLVKEALIRGLGILLPVLLLILVLGEMVQLAVALAEPIADVLLPGSFLESEYGALVGWVVFFLIVLILGFVAYTRIGARVGRAMERNTVERLPVYRAIKSIARGLVGDSQQDFRPVLVDYGDDTAGLGFLVEEIDERRIAVLEPWVPTPMAATIRIMPRSRARELDASFGEVAGALSRWGAGTRALLSGS